MIMSVSILISSAVICLIINTVLDILKPSNQENKKSNDDSYNGDSITTDSNLVDKIDEISTKINDIFKVLKNDNTKNAITETNTYIKATINEITVVKKTVDKILNTESNSYETQLLNLENKIDGIREEFLEKFNSFESLINSIKPVATELPKPEEEIEIPDEITESVVEETEEKEEDNRENKSTVEQEAQETDEEIDREFNPGEIDLETTPIETIVEEQKIDEKTDIMDNFLEEDNSESIEEKLEETEEQNKLVEENTSKNIEETEESIENNEETKEDNNEIDIEDEEEDDEEDIEKENDENKEKEEDKNNEEDIDDTVNNTEDEELKEEIEEEKQQDAEEKIESENVPEEDLATKIKKLKEKLNATVDNQ